MYARDYFSEISAMFNILSQNDDEHISIQIIYHLSLNKIGGLGPFDPKKKTIRMRFSS